MADEKDEAAGAAPEAPAPKSGMGKVLLIGVGALALGGGGAAAWFLGLIPHGSKVEPAAEAKEPKHEAGAIVPLDPFIANLADEDGKRYLKAALQVEFFEGKAPEEFKTPQVRDLLLTLFSSKQFAEIRTPEGKAVLREEIINRLNRALHKDVVKQVYFTEFIVQ